MRLARAVVVAALAAALLDAGARTTPAVPASAAEEPPPPAAVPTAAPPAVAQPAGVAVAPLRHLDARAAALLMSGRRGGALEAALAIGTPEGSGAGRRLPYRVELRGAPLAPAAAAGTRELQTFAYVLDERDEVGAFSGFAVRLELAACGEQLRSSGARLHGTVALPPTARTLRVLLRDVGNGAFALEEASLAPFATGGDGPAGIVEFPPAATAWVEVLAPELTGAGAVAEPPPLPAARPVLATPGRTRFELVGNPALARVEALSGRFVDGRGIATPIAGLDLVGRGEPIDGVARLTVDCPIPTLPAGAYTLELSSAAGGAGRPLAEARVVAWPAAEIAAVTGWAALPAAEPPAAQPAADAPELAAAGDADTLRTRYLEALRRLTAGDETAARDAVVALERDALAPGSSWSPARLVRLELGVDRALTKAAPDAVVPLLVLHGEVAHERLGAGDAAGTLRALSVGVELLRSPRIADADPATRTAAAEAAAALAETFLAIGAPLDTRTLLERARELAPDSVPVAIGLAAACEVTGDYWRVVATLGPLLERGGAPIELRLRLGVNLRRVERPGPAAAALTACVEPTSPTWVRVLATEELALLQLDRDRPAEAAAVLEQGLVALPDAQSLLVLLAYVSEQSGRIARARRVLQQLDRLATAGPVESPRLRYARWSNEQLRGQREGGAQAARERLPALAAALASVDAGGGG